MIENEINLIADKLGMTINQIYQMNIQYQHFAAIQGAISITIPVILLTIWIAIVYRANRSDTDRLETLLGLGIVFGGCIACLIGIIIWLLFGFIALPIMFPEYAAMIQTMSQIKSFIP